MIEVGELANLARQKAVGFEVIFEESSNSWFGEITSPAKAERRGFKKYSSLFDMLEAMEDWIRSL